MCKNPLLTTGPEVIKRFQNATQLSMKFILLINVKMPTIVGNLFFISMINTTSERLKARNYFCVQAANDSTQVLSSSQIVCMRYNYNVPAYSRRRRRTH